MSPAPGPDAPATPVDKAALVLHDTTHLSGAQKAAILLLRMGKERAAGILRQLGEAEVTQITAEVARAGNVLRADVDAVLSEFATLAVANDHLATGGVGAARDLLEASLGDERAGEIMDRLLAAFAKAPFEFLSKADPRQLIHFLRDEHPQTIALVLAHVRADLASVVLGGLSEDTQREVSVRVATLRQTSPEVVDAVEAHLAKRLSSVMQEASTVRAADGVQTLVEILNRSDRATERSIFEGLEDHDEELADQVRSRMFVFEDIVSLDDRAVQLVLRQVETKELATALKGVRPEVKSKITQNMSERAAQTLSEEIVLLGPVRMKTVEESQGAIVRVIRALEESGQIVVSRGTEEFVA